MALMVRGGIGRGQVTSFPDFLKADGTWDKTDATTGANAVDYVSRELKFDYESNRTKGLITAMATPADWLKERQIRIDGGASTELKDSKNAFVIFPGIKNVIAEHYAKKMNKYKIAGLPFAEANARASASANRLLEEEMEELELEYPGGSTIFASAAQSMADRNAKFGMATGQAESGLDEKAVYKRIRRAKKAKKAKRRAKLAAKNTA